MKNPFNSERLGGWLNRLRGGGGELAVFIPATARPGARWNIEPRQVAIHLAGARADPSLLLKEAVRYLEKLNQCQTGADTRYTVSDTLLSEAAPAARALLARSGAQGGGLPESAGEAVRFVEHLAISYKMILRHDYAHLAGGRGEACQRFAACALRLLELARLEQSLRALRGQKLPASVWRDCNQVFFAAAGVVDVNAAAPAPVSFDGIAAGDKNATPRMTSLHDAYVALHITALLDMNAWPAFLLAIVEAYVGLAAASVPLLQDDGAPLGTSQVVVYPEQETFAQFMRKMGTHSATTPLIIDLTPLVTRVTEDRRRLTSLRRRGGGGEEQVLAAPLLRLGEKDRLPFYDLLLQRLSPQGRRNERQGVFGRKYARLCAGFIEIYALLREQGKKPAEEAAQAGEASVAGTMNLYSGLRLEDEAAMEVRWVVADESEGGIQLRTRETPYLRALSVGRLVAYSVDESAALAPFKLGYVARLNRPGEHEMEVAIACLPGEASAVTVEETESVEPESQTAILLRDTGKRLQLLCRSELNLVTGDALLVHQEKRDFPAALGGVKVARQDFQLFDLLIGQD